MSRLWLDLRKDKIIRSFPYALFVVGISLVAFVSTESGKKFVENLSSQAIIVGAFITPSALKEIGLAIAIVGLVSITIERSRVKIFSEELGREVRNKLDEIEETSRRAIFQGPLPGEYYQHVSEIMLMNRFLRPEWTFRIGFTWRDETAEYLNFSFDQEYKIKNLHGIEKKYEIVHWESQDWDDKFPGSTRIRYVRAKYENQEEWLISRVAPEGGTLGESSDGFIKFKEEVELLPGSVVYVQAGTAKVMREREFEGLFNLDPTLGARCWVECPEDLIVVVEAAHPKEKSRKQTELEKIGGGRVRYYWEFSQPLQPYSAIVLKWRKREIQVQSVTSPNAKPQRNLEPQTGLRGTETGPDCGST